jgi:citrate synthase
VELIEVPAGLAGVAVTSTTVGDVLGDEGFYHYRGRSAVGLARTATFEDAAALVLDESGQPAMEAAARALPDDVAAVVDRVDLRSGLSLLAHACCSGPLVDLPRDARRADAVRLISALPTLIASVHHRRPLAPRDDLGHVANYLWMLTGRADAESVRALQTYFVLTIDHGFNTSTFTARVVASTGADLGACVVAALAALTGPRHGAVQGRVLDMLDEIGEPDRAESWMKTAVASRRRLLGFGHSVYRVADPRAVLLAEVCAELAPDRSRLARAADQAGQRVLAGRRLAANVDLYAPIVLEACGIPPELFTATFAAARIVGWCAHALEQAAEPMVIRPAAYYIGPPPQLGG